LKKILVAGPLANDKHAWLSRYGPQSLDFVTPLEGIRQKLGAGVDVRYVKGVDVIDARFPESDVYQEPPDSKTRDGIAEAVASAADVDVIIAVLGETEQISQESASRISLDLPGHQDALLRALQATGKPLLLVLSNGRPLSVNWAAKNVPAIVEMWFPGEQGGAALADVLFGDYNPSGRLPITMPKSVGQIPFNFPAHPGSQGRDPGQVEGPLYPFGHGLSYTSFKYSDLKLVPVQTKLGPSDAPRPLTVQVTLNVTNTGERAGDDVVQLYLRDDYSSVTTYVKALRGFARVSLKPGEVKPVPFQLTDADMALYDREQRWTVEPGRFTVMIGTSSEVTKLQGHFYITAPDGALPDEPPVVNESTDPI
jgi:beta-glucosidase